MRSFDTIATMLRTLLPLLLFLFLFLGSGFVAHLQNMNDPFAQVPPTVAMIPTLLLAFIFRKGKHKEKMDALIQGMSHPDILMMCMIFLLSGAFGSMTRGAGCVEATTRFMVAHLPHQALLPGLFLISSSISMAMGSSMGVIASIVPIAVPLAREAQCSLPLSIGTMVGGAMFGDNLSFISDTTIASVRSLNASLLKKFRLNALPATLAATLCMFLITFTPTTPPPSAAVGAATMPFAASLSWLIFPYVLVIFLALLRWNVLLVLLSGMSSTIVLGIHFNEYSWTTAMSDIMMGLTSMNQILILSLMIGGLSGLFHKDIISFTGQLQSLVSPERPRHAELMLSALTMVICACIANNTITILIIGIFAKQIAYTASIPPERIACWIDIFSCVTQGLIPYGAQILLASQMSQLSPFVIASHNYYCWILGLVSLLLILLHPSWKNGSTRTNTPNTPKTKSK